MVFSSLLFLFIFLPAFLLVYFITPKKFKNTVLFISSLIFYAWGEPVYVLLMLFSTVVDYTHGMLVYRFKNQGKIRKAKLVVLSSVIINLGLLGFFKYTDFLIGTFNSVFGTSAEFLHIALPIGISFYTFQTMSYTLDIYKGDAEPQRNIINFGTYVALFPQLIAGPIVQYKTVAKELSKRSTNCDSFAEGLHHFIVGLGKKVLLANNIGILWDTVKAIPSEDMTVLAAWLGIIAYTFQIYFDFDGYSEMAIGLGKILGFTFPKNFDYPYISTSITEFWRRWHITLGTWFREYVYIPLGGNRRGLLIQMRNIAIVWLLTGIWHGAAYNFILWGAYFGIILMIEKLFLLKFMEKWPAFFRHLYSLVLIVFGWVLFGFDELSMVAKYFGYLFGINTAGIVSSSSLFLLRNYALLLVIMAVASTPLAAKLFGKIMTALQDRSIISTVMVNVYNVAVFLMSVAYLVDATYNPFLYFRF